ncbi:glycoside hydrolase family 132 protein [Aaosphaeria arxii CBS 175.79]|uniref:Glycoside hydrolase family 132 protein n=1 Tax=Aaosphaeria arxii CBS 175.79 TaxID=1450172 RepID=A0A6A5XRW4_9PLEO|nr:glycoside hydrolase family 132 protein [Aaosphaeria arxii CBS 175.79]KAF2015004.1 glycoside hydrolase family 132 protein [Aaosphaeria arxii CBS 175.79]
MKASTLVAVAAAVTAAVAQPRQVHRHHPLRNEIKRQDFGSVVYEAAPIATIIVYVLNGQPISEQEVRQGIANGTLMWGDDGVLSTSTSSVSTPTPISLPAPSVELPKTSAQPEIIEEHHPEVPSKTDLPSAPAAQPEPEPTPEPSSKPESQAPPPQLNGLEGVNRPFPNGEFSCDAFPKGYGAQPVQHAGLGGWIGIQDPQIVDSAGFDDITTTPHGTCSDGTCCKAGAFCSYSCPPGYLKSSWPERQGLKGQSIGGLYCNLDNKLELATGAIAKTLCVRGTDKVTIKVHNKLKRKQSTCRTDYPGSESETVPITTNPGDFAELACPETDTYYHWNGKSTSAQYYLNNGGVEESEACQWGDGSKPVGNFAPVNLGVGFSSADQKGYISLFQNSPTTNAKLDFTVELQADDMNGNCKYSNGEFHYGENYSKVATGDNRGCTVALNSGTLTVVLTEN